MFTLAHFYITLHSSVDCYIIRKMSTVELIKSRQNKQFSYKNQIKQYANFKMYF